MSELPNITEKEKKFYFNELMNKIVQEHITRAGEPEPGVFGSLEPEPLKKKRGAGAAWKKKSGAGAGKN